MLKKVMSKFHPDLERVFQRALPGEVTSEKEVWFMKAPLGRNLGDMLSGISKAAGLSTRYTNHCIWATAVGILKRAGIDDRSICSVTLRSRLASVYVRFRIDTECTTQVHNIKIRVLTQIGDLGQVITSAPG